MNILYLLPKNLLSRLAGQVMHCQLPGAWGRALNQKSIAFFARLYQINLAEAEKPLSEYPSIGEFFIRRLKPGMRPLQAGRFLHPADSRISQIARISQGSLIQAKGKLYGVEDLLSEGGCGAVFEGGLFATYYLCPTDYHRVHSPVDAKITSVVWVPGGLWPVNNWSVERIDQLFCVNERVIVNLQVGEGAQSSRIALVLVGATNVGKISLSFEPRVVSNQGSQKQPLRIEYPKGISIARGDEIGMFHMGSTVVTVIAGAYLPESLSPSWLEGFKNKTVKMGETLF